MPDRRGQILSCSISQFGQENGCQTFPSVFRQFKIEQQLCDQKKKNIRKNIKKETKRNKKKIKTRKDDKKLRVCDP